MEGLLGNGSGFVSYNDLRSRVPIRADGCGICLNVDLFLISDILALVGFCLAILVCMKSETILGFC